MAIKTMTVNLGGQDRELRFGKMGFLEHISEIFSGDPLQLLTGIIPPKDQFQLVYAYVYAGLKCAKVECTKEQVYDWVYDLDIEIAAEIATKVKEAMLGGNGQAGEQQAQTLVSQSHGGS